MKNDRSKKDKSLVVFFPDAFVLRFAFSCKFLCSESLDFSKIDAFYFSDKSAEKGSSFCGTLCSKGSSLSVMTVSFKIADGCKIVLVFLLIGFFY